MNLRWFKSKIPKFIQINFFQNKYIYLIPSFPLLILYTLQGFPKAVTLERISFDTTDPASIVTLSPIVTPGKMQTFPPIQTLFPIFILFQNSKSLFLNSTFTG